MHGRVVSTTRLTPHLVRVVLGGEGLAGFALPDCTDAYLNVALPPGGGSYDTPIDLEGFRDRLPREAWPARRRYTVRRWDAAAGELTIDFVVHGDTGVGGPWATTAEAGDLLCFTGPGGDYRPDPTADWHLLVGDESALPAIGASLEAMPEGVPVVAIVLVDAIEEELPLTSPGALDLRWLHRAGGPEDADLLCDAVTGLRFPEGRVHAFVHGEAGEVRAVRRHLLGERPVARADLSASAYWRRDMSDEAWREIKQDWNAEVERDVP